MSDGVITGALETVSDIPIPSLESRRAALVQLLMILDEAASKSDGRLTTPALRSVLERLVSEIDGAFSEFSVQTAHPALELLSEAIRALEGLESGDRPHAAFQRQKDGSAALPIQRLDWDNWFLEQVDFVMKSRGFRHRSYAEREIATVLRKEGISRKGKPFTSVMLRELRKRRKDRERDKNPRVTPANRPVD